ncbi:MAG TPA: PHB depolymerase family esterase [Polyangia bacterium]|nr:PHB depolymerase family esterase [Polyangia bacterium]
MANLPSDVSMWVYLPAKMATNPPILVLIHSCGNDANGVMGQAGDLKTAADQYGYIMVVPQSNPSSKRCWTTDSTQVWTRDKGGDSNAIKQMVVYAISTYHANADRVYVTGCSSGAMMTELLLGLYPDIFKAGSSFAGMPAGCHGPNDNSSNATGYNGSCAGGMINYTPQQWGDLVRAMDPGYTGHRPRLQLFHGSADNTISYANMAESASQYINLQSLSTTPTKTNTGLTLGTHQATEQQWNNACGYLVLDAFDSINGDHGPSDTLFVGKYVVPFLGLDKTGAVDPEIQQCGASGGGGTSGGTGGQAGMGAGGGHSGGAGAGGSGTGGAAGGRGTGGAIATGGTNGNGGSTGSTGGVSGTGTGGNPGSSGGSGGSSTTGTGGHLATGGTNGASGGSTGAGNDASSGGCTLAGGARSSNGLDLAALGIGLGLVLGAARKRRRR